ncbi:cytochrome d ubiquinol oxidase subunit II [Sphaerisporangium sp. TRM90804]|uniref:cytochrome d ubiquinol oxidase subunit II n=1 Tax=Sphaerisporangium sp. TRM90804 TaxID=3031113 RepID=UPI00244736BF|nr:cytochrome d ubiquinol oxidase subunit II [Sphaerisporangium sp. TRM90804]MDH2429579.1 cytochrome d ubiquinol oxidase subunit II [Sphaerisporangium sp. TRM90804]
MEIIWLAVFAALLIGYFALEGFDIGVGMLLPVLSRASERAGEPGTPQAHRDRLVAAVAPFVLANEVWLVAVAGALIGVYPSLEGEVLHGLYPVVVALLVSWVMRDAGLWFRRRLDGARWRAFWDAALCAASWGLALTWGVALASVVRGLPANPFDALGLLYGAVVAAALAVHGRAFAAWRLSGADEPGTGRRLALTAALAALPVAVPLAVVAPTLLDHSASPAALNVLSIMALPVLPIVLAAQVWVWRTFGPARDPKTAARLPSFF